MKNLVPCFALLLASLAGFAKSIPLLCGSYPERTLSEIHLSKEESRRRIALAAPGVVRDVGDIVVMDRSGGVVGRRNPFDLEGRTLAFQRSSAAGYRVALGGPGAVSAGPRRLALGDDDAVEVELPFEFPFHGLAYRSVFVNSDGNLTFAAADAESTARTLGRMVAGPPRIAGLFRDLDPERSGQVTMEVAGSSVTFSWIAVPEYRAVGVGPRQTFAIRLEESGRIEFVYQTVNTESAVVGISPGDFQGSTSVVSFDSAPEEEFFGTVAETFELNPGLDLVRVAQRFYETHGDNYDYLVIFNALGLSADGAIAFQMPIRVTADGFGLRRGDIGRIFGSRSRLQSILNMGPLTQYPQDPAQIVNFRPGSGESTLTILAHEAGHQYLSFVSVPDPRNPFALPMLGRQQAHWSFFFNSDASILEGNRIDDRGEGANPRFVAAATVEGYSALDRYLMGLGAAEELQPTFYVRPVFSANRPEDAPRLGASFNGERVDIPAEALAGIAGRRTPDHTVAQNRFRMAFILVTDEGANPAPEDVAKLDQLRREFEPYFARATGGRGAAETSLREEARFETFPALGVVRGQSGRLALELRDPAPFGLGFRLVAEKGLLSVPSGVEIPAGGRRVEFTATGLAEGVEELRAEPERGEFETARLRVQVAAASFLRLSVAEVGPELRVRLTDVNQLPYPGARVTATPLGSSVVDRDSAETDRDGVARFGWQRGLGSVEFAVGDARVQAPGIPVLASALNAASLRARVSPGSLVSAFGVAVAGPGLRVTVGGREAEIVRSSFGQVDFVVPGATPLGLAEVVVRNDRGASPPVLVEVAEVAPAVFVDGSTGLGAAVVAGVIRPFRSGEIVEIYGTGLRTPVQVHVGGLEAEVFFAGQPTGLPGVWQVNARIPGGVPAGEQPLVVTASGEAAEAVRVAIAP